MAPMVAGGHQNIMNWVDSTQRRSNSLFSSGTTPGSSPTYYAASLSISNANSCCSRLPKTQRSVATKTANTSSTGGTVRSAVFDSVTDTRSSSSICTDIPRNGPDQTWRPPVLPPAAEPEPEVASVVMIPCEWSLYGNCNVLFPDRAVDDMVSHMASHVHDRFPKHGKCWFCPIQFSTESSSAADCREAYWCRMSHIADHFSHGKTIADARPDHDFLDHLHDYALIPEAQYQEKKQHEEVPPGYVNSYMTSTGGAVVPERAVILVENSQRNRGQGSSRPIRTQAIHP